MDVAPRPAGQARGDSLVGHLSSVVTRHPDLLLVLGLLLVAGAVRLAFLPRAPLFLRHDSVAYFQTGYEWARGQGFDLPLRRTPLYPLFIGAVVWAFGEEERGLALAQHLLGLVAVAVTYLLGKAVFGRLAGAAAGLLVGLSAPLLILEHYILAEPLFIPLFVLGLLAVTRALHPSPPPLGPPLRGGSGQPPSVLVRVGGQPVLYLAGGLLLALAALARPIGQAVLPLVPLVILGHHLLGAGRGGLSAGLRAALRPVALVVIGVALVYGPWLGYAALADGRAGSGGALGQTLVGRIIRHDEGFVLPHPDSPSRHTDPTAVAVRRLILAQMARDARPSAINHRVRNVFGLTEPQANAAMQDVALEVFRSQPERFVVGTWAKLRRMVVGEDERLRVHWSTRKDGELRDDWTAEASIAHLYRPPSTQEEQEYSTAEAVTRLFQPYHWRGPLAALILLGIGLGLLRGPRAPIVLLLLAAAALLVPSAMLVGYVPRYRYPVDPLLAVFAGGGLVAVGSLARAATGLGRGRLREWRVRRPIEQVSHPGGGVGTGAVH